MQVESVKQVTPKKTGKILGTAAGLGISGVYVAKNRKEIITDRGVQFANQVKNNIKDTFLKGVRETANLNIKNESGQKMFVDKMSSAFEKLVNGDKEAFKEISDKAAQALGSKKENYLNMMKNLPESVAKNLKNAKGKGLLIGSLIAIGVMVLAGLTGKLLGGAIGGFIQSKKAENRVDKA